MQETGIIETQERAEDGVLLMTRTGDGVEGLICFPHFARCDIQQPARHLILE